MFKKRMLSFIAIVTGVVTFILMTAPISNGQDFAKVGTSGAHFLDIGMGARGVAMGDAYTAVGATDATATFWNPSAMAFGDGMNFVGTYVQYFADITYGSGAVALPVDNVGTFGLSFAYLNTGEMEETTVYQPEGTGEMFSASDVMIGVTYSRALTDKFAFGGNFKYIQETLADLKASAVAFDLSTLYYTGFRSLRLGMIVRNFGPDLEFDGDYIDYNNGTPLPDKEGYSPFHMPLTFKVGMAYDIFQANSTHQITLSADAVHPNDSYERINLGGEYTFLNTLAVRGGFITNHDTAGLTLGLGVNMANFQVDYLYSDFGVLDNVNQFTIGMTY